MSNTTLRHKFFVGMITIMIVSIVILFGNRLMGKAALFHYLERLHLENVMQMDAMLTLAEQGAKNAGSLRRRDLLNHIDTASGIAGRADTETFFFEKSLFRMLGFGGLLDLPIKDIEDLQRMKTIIAGMPGDGVTEELAVKLRADKEIVLDNSHRFTVLVQDAVAFIQATVMILGMLAVAALAGTLYFLYRSTLPPIEQAIAIAQRIAKGDLTARITAQSNDEFGTMFNALRDMNDNLARLVDGVRNGTESMAAVTGEIAAGNVDLSARTESQAGSIEETAATVEELTVNVKKNAENAQHANQLAVAASEHATKGGVVVESVVETMGRISHSSSRIADIIGVIDGIAFQTNILALNAAVEAARAGEQGRGFAVVASEVRTLAQRSAAAAKEIKELISSSVETVEAGSRLVNDAGTTMSDIVASVKRVAGIMGEITVASQEQSSGISQINQAISSIDHTTQQNAALVEEASAAAQSLRNHADELARAVSLFKLVAADKQFAGLPR